MMMRTVLILGLPVLVAACGGQSSPSVPDTSGEEAGKPPSSKTSKTPEGPATGETPAPNATGESANVTQNADEKPMAKETNAGAGSDAAARSEIATLGGGCFWCVEAVLEQLDGIVDVKSGYMGGDIPNPTYRQVSTGTTGHAEVVQVTFDPSRISYDEILDYFWKLHDPTTLNRQGNDVGPQYRSVIFYHSEGQKKASERSKEKLAKSGAYPDPIVTEITEAGPFYEAEDYHQDYYRLNRRQPYCQYVIAPKLDKLGLEK